jgi:hypothetical protein
LVVVCTVKAPLRRLVQHVLVNDAAPGVRARGKPVLRDDNIGTAHVASLAICRRIVHALHRALF